MQIIRDTKRSFDLAEFLTRPLFAHLATVCEQGPRDSPVWFHWEEGALWMIGTPQDSFPKRIKADPRCAVGIVDFDPKQGRVLHAGFRGWATVEPFDPDIATRLLSRYLGPSQQKWDPRFRDLDQRNRLIRFHPKTVVLRDQSYTPTSGP
ncbi:MAG: pyridoxamine 5'-phosphate oxidase family protein [Firmicutes bacterium]|nr:pyridoxamine 5'-phosphate oxidase family protein [Bacillota bacterium]